MKVGVVGTSLSGSAELEFFSITDEVLQGDWHKLCLKAQAIWSLTVHLQGGPTSNVCLINLPEVHSVWKIHSHIAVTDTLESSSKPTERLLAVSVALVCWD